MRRRLDVALLDLPLLIAGVAGGQSPDNGTLPDRSQVRLAVFTLLGPEVAVFQGGLLDAGVHAVVFGAGRLPAAFTATA